MKHFIKTIKYLSQSIIFLTCNTAIGQTELNVAQVIQSDCDQSTDIDRVQHRIISQSYRNNTFEVEIGTIANCAGISDVFADYSNDTINFYFDHGWLLSDTVIVGGEIRVFGTLRKVGCDCCFEFKFIVHHVPREPRAINVNGTEFKYFPDKYKTYPVKFDVFQSDTINYVDKYGLKQGHWNKFYNEPDFYFVNTDNYEFTAFYVNDTAKTADLKVYYPSGKVKSTIQKRDFNYIIETDYYENGEISSQRIDKGYKSGHVSYSFYENGSLHSVDFRTPDYSETVIYYRDNKLKKISNRFIDREYYPNGALKYERLFSREKDNIWAKYYYDNGNIMSISYVRKSKKDTGQSKNWRKYYDIDGKKTSREDLIRKGYKNILEM